MQRERTTWAAHATLRQVPSREKMVDATMETRGVFGRICSVVVKIEQRAKTGARKGLKG